MYKIYVLKLCHINKAISIFMPSHFQSKPQ